MASSTFILPSFNRSTKYQRVSIKEERKVEGGDKRMKDRGKRRILKTTMRSSLLEPIVALCDKFII